MVTEARATPIAVRRVDIWPKVVSAVGLLLVAAVIAWLIVNWVKSPETFYTSLFVGVTLGALYGLVALGYTLVYGILELINFAHGDVFMLGAMISATMLISVFGLESNPSISLLVPAIFGSLGVAVFACSLLNAAVEKIAYRPLRGAPRLVPLITAIGMSFILEGIALIWKGPGYVSLPIRILPSGTVFAIGGASFQWGKLIVILITVPVLIGLIWLVRYTRQGKAMRATAQDRDAAAMMGISVDRTISFTFLVAGALAGVAGIVYALYVGNIRYDQGFQLGLISFTAAVLGGIGNLTGALLGALLIGLIQAFNEGLSWHAPGASWTTSVVFAILILILVFRPAGLLGEQTPEGQ